MKVVLISGHDGNSDRKTGFHFWAEILAARGANIYFLTVGSSFISLFKKNGKRLKKPFNRWVSIGERIQKYTWLPLFHPMYFSNKILSYLSWPVFALYPYLMPRRLLEPLKQADWFIIESGAGPILVPRLARLNPNAKFIYNSSDRPGVVAFHPIVTRAEKKTLPYFNVIRLNAAIMAKDFPPGAPIHYIPQAIDKFSFDKETQNPYSRAKNAINIGDMLFDTKTVEELARAYPDWNFHLFGKGAKISKPMKNVIEYGETPFEKLIPYLQHADIGLAPYSPSPEAGYLSQSSLKIVQYTYCRLPIVAPDFAAALPHVMSYTHGSTDRTAAMAFKKAIEYDRTSIDKNSVYSWNDVIDQMMSLATDRTKIVFLATLVPGVICGVNDYIKQLADAIRQQGMQADIEFQDTWSFRAVLGLMRKYKGDPNVIFHLEYPTLGMGNSVSPGLLPILLFPHRVFTTLHEFSIFNILRKIIFIFHAILGKKIIFTNEWEKKKFVSFFPMSANKTTIVPIGGNIPVSQADVSAKCSKDRIIYFGQISPNKGIELYTETIRLLRAANANFDAAIIGSIVEEDNVIVRHVRKAAQDCDIELCLNYPAEDVSRELHGSTIALLAFPDGITEKRSSALACAAHGNVIVSLHSEKTPSWLRSATHHISTPEDAASLIATMIEGKKPRALDENAMIEPLAAREWPEIAKRHIALYKRHAKA